MSGVKALLGGRGQLAGAALAVFGFGLLFGQVAWGSPSSHYVNVLTVNDYTWWNWPGSGCDTFDGDPFWTYIGGVSGLQQRVNLKDSAVFDIDFYDPELTQNSNDGDWSGYGADPPGNAVSLVCGHGSCDDGTRTTCTKAADCAGVNGVCPGTPPSAYLSRCVQNNTPSKLIYTANSSNWHGNIVRYGGGLVAWGESPQSGAWRNPSAGTNGGANLVTVLNSCGLRAPFWSQVANAFAGAHIIAGMMPVTMNNCPRSDCNSGVGDAYGGVGGEFAHQGSINPQASIFSAWSAALDSAPNDPSSSCPDFTENYQYGGGSGFRSCGCNYVMAQDYTALVSIWHTGESWLQIQDDTLDATGSQGGPYAQFHCNYDNNTYPFTK